MKELLDIS